MHCFHAQSDVALHYCCVALVVAVGWSAAGGGFCGRKVHLPELDMIVGQGDVSSDLSSIFCPGSFIRIAAPAFRLMRFLVPLLYCLHCSLFLAARLLAVVLGSLLGWSNFTAVGSKVRVRRPFRFWAASLTWDVAPSEDRQYWVSFVFLCFQEQSFAGLRSIFHFSIRLAHRDIGR